MLPTMAEAVIPPPPAKPRLGNLPPVITITPADAAYFAEACDEWSEWGQYDEESWMDDFPGLTNDDACNWAIYGYTVQDQLTMEQVWASTAAYTESLESQITFLTDYIRSIERIFRQQDDAIKNISNQIVPPPVEEKRGFFRRLFD